MKVMYIGRFPPPYGGVTIKNKMLYEKMKQNIPIKKINLDLVKKANIKEVAKFLITIFNKEHRFIIGTAGKYRKYITMILFFGNRVALNKSILIVMGGVTSRVIAKDRKYLKWVKEYRMIYVETQGMKNELVEAGLENVSLFPNCRERPLERKQKVFSNSDRVKLLFFSSISKDKGVDIVLDSLDYLEENHINYSIDFYGHIDEEYKEEFFREVNLKSEIKYLGVFKETNDILYNKISEYDLLLLPTKSNTEGVPGILVESKISGVPAIVSNVSYNSDIIQDGINGYVMSENTPEELAKLILSFNEKKPLQEKLKQNAIESSEFYIIDKYINSIVNEITRV